MLSVGYTAHLQTLLRPSCPFRDKIPCSLQRTNQLFLKLKQIKVNNKDYTYSANCNFTTVIGSVVNKCDVSYDAFCHPWLWPQWFVNMQGFGAVGVSKLSSSPGGRCGNPLLYRASLTCMYDVSDPEPCIIARLDCISRARDPSRCCNRFFGQSYWVCFSNKRFFNGIFFK